MKKRDVTLLLNFVILNNNKNKFDANTYFKDDENVKSIIFYVSIVDMENPIFSKILKYLSEKNKNVPKLMISLSEFASENIAVFSYLIRYHKEYRCWGLTIDERNYDHLDIKQSLVWLAEQDVLTELNLNTHILTLPSLPCNQFLKCPHLERFYMGREFKDISVFFENYTVQSYFDESNLYVRDKRIVNIMKRNQNLRQLARKCSLTLMMIRKFHYSLFSPLDKNVVKIIARFLYEQRYETIHLKTLSISTSGETKFEDKKSLEIVETLL